MFGFERNHYDRLAHFSVGFYAYPIAEILLKKRLVLSSAVLAMFPIFAIFTVAGGYEVFEWLYAIYADPNAGIAVLGSQGDVWDAQKDILADGLGSMAAVAAFLYVYRAELGVVKNVRCARWPVNCAVEYLLSRSCHAPEGLKVAEHGHSGGQFLSVLVK